MVSTIILGIIVAIVVISWLTQRPKNFPPGPPSLPLIGSIFSVPSQYLHLTLLNKWTEKYGSVVGIIVGRRRMVTVCGYREVLEVLRKEEFQGRPRGQFFKDRSFNKLLGVFFSDGGFWMEQRRFTLRHLRDFGFGKKSMERVIIEEIEDVMKEMTKNEVFQVSGFFTVPTLNVLWSMISSNRYSRDDAELQSVLDKVTRFFRAGNITGGILVVLPFLKAIAPGFTGYTERINDIKGMQNFFRESIKEHQKSIDENNPRDLIDVYLKEMNLQRNNPNTSFTEEGLITLCLDLFAAGGETTTSTLGFSLLYMILYPRVQKAVQKELDTVIGRDRRPSLDDRPRLDYVEAVITELFRVCSIAPLTPPHRATRDTYLSGYSIPKDTTLLICLYSLFQDKEHWGDPEVFRPERFLDKHGNFVKDEWILPFGTGKRVCLGEALARNTVFLVFTSLLQEFSFSIPEGDPEPTTYPLSGLTIAPQPFRVKATKR